MTMSNWWNRNASFVKAYTGYVVMLLALRALAGILRLHNWVVAPIRALGLSKETAFWTSAVFAWILFLVVGFYIFRNQVRKFVLHGAE